LRKECDRNLYADDDASDNLWRESRRFDARGKRATLAKLVLAPAWRFWRGLLLRGGFRDGWHGLVYAYVRANYVRQKTIMLWMLQQGQPVSDPPRHDDAR